MRSLAITAENFENQRQTVMEERRQSYENRPYMLSFLRRDELSFQGYWPYEHSTIGDDRPAARLARRRARLPRPLLRARQRGDLALG
ncbi:MAG: hypothetical protein U0325_34695 [Polyangiales bacterium]